MKWRIGDLGRFAAEEPKRPRFEVINAAADGIVIWYGGERTTRRIPVATFKRDCVNWWDCQAINLQALPPWFGRGAKFNLHGRGRNLVQAVVADRYGLTKNYLTMDVRDAELEVRRVQADFASCLLRDDKMLVLIPLRDVVSHGSRVRTRWDKLVSDEEIIDELHDLYDD